MPFIRTLLAAYVHQQHNKQRNKLVVFIQGCVAGCHGQNMLYAM